MNPVKAESKEAPDDDVNDEPDPWAAAKTPDFDSIYRMDDPDEEMEAVS